MEDVTNLLNIYRECSRHLWNSYYIKLFTESSSSDDILDRFESIDRLLFSSLVLSKLNKLSFENDFGKNPLHFLQIEPATEESPILINRPSTDRNKYWDESVNRVSASECILHFIGYFDWDKYSFAEYAYYWVKIASFAKYPSLVGREALILTTNARAIYSSQVQS
jgi:hypothetical protein